MFYKILFFIIALVVSGIILNHNCNCNEDKDKPFDIIQIWIVYFLSLFFVDLKSVILFISFILLSFVLKEILKLIVRKKKKIKITKEDCGCKNAYKRFL